jgi:hypothetical protein
MTALIDTVYLGLSYAGGPPAAARQQGPEMLEKLSGRTGGLHFRVRNQAEANEAMVKAGQALRSQYLIGYHAPDSGSIGKWHRVQVKLDRAQGKSMPAPVTTRADNSSAMFADHSAHSRRPCPQSWDVCADLSSFR